MADKGDEPADARIYGSGGGEKRKRPAHHQDKDDDARLLDKAVVDGRKNLPGLRDSPHLLIGERALSRRDILPARNKPGKDGAQHNEQGNDNVCVGQFLHIPRNVQRKNQMAKMSVKWTFCHLPYAKKPILGHWSRLCNFLRRSAKGTRTEGHVRAGNRRCLK